MKRMRTLVLASLAALLVVAAPAGAVTGGVPDGEAHPYVVSVLVPSTGMICSGSLISSTRVVTAAHCFAGDEDYALIGTGNALDVVSEGVARVHPAFCVACGGGLPGLFTHDLAVVQLAYAIELDRYAQLPALGLSEQLGRASLTVVGYGVQGFANVKGGKVPVFDLERTRASVTLNPGKFAWSDEFLRISANKGGICFGDSGGPNLLGDTIVAINSFAGQLCTGNTYSYRLDTPAAQSFIAQFG